MEQTDESQDHSGQSVHAERDNCGHEDHGNSHERSGGRDNSPGLDVGFFHKKRMLDLMLVPPGGWRWTCPKHGIKFKADFYPELLSKVVNYLKANKMEVQGSLDAWLQDCMCNQNNWGAETCKDV